jgi:hypothetical protein
MMHDNVTLKTYNELRALVSPEAFLAAMNFVAWHNRQAMTPMLKTWQALVVAYAHERYHFDFLHYSTIKRFLSGIDTASPDSLAKCQALSGELHTLLTPANDT